MPKKNYNTLIWILAITINGLITTSIFLPKLNALKGYNFSFLPLLNAILNSLTFLSLLIALTAIKRKNRRRHKRFVFLAFSFTTLFLLSYLLYHFSTPSTKYGGPPFLRYIYLFILLTHIPLAILIVPLALITMGRGLNGNIAKHRNIARWTMPIWLYVSGTGVIVYWMISPYLRYLK